MEKYRAASETKNKKVEQQLYKDVVALLDEIVKLGNGSNQYGIAMFNAAVILMGRPRCPKIRTSFRRQSVLEKQKPSRPKR